jgi:hypothetical protein
LNTHDNVIDFEDVIIILIEVYVSTSDTEPTNQVTACMNLICQLEVTMDLVYIECHLQGRNTGG